MNILRYKGTYSTLTKQIYDQSIIKYRKIYEIVYYMNGCEYGSLLAEAWKKEMGSSQSKVSFDFRVSLSAYEVGCAGRYKASAYK